MLRNIFRLIGISTVAVASLAVAQSQATESQSIRAGIVICESGGKAGFANGQPVSAGPYAWYNLQSNHNIKPASWNLLNPNASSILTPEMQARWNLITGTTIPAGSRLTKKNAPYWEVFLSRLSDAALARYDVLLVNPANYAILTPVERERLRRFVDGGGLLWIDAGAMQINQNGMDYINNWPLAFKVASGGATTNYQSDLSQPILASPNPLSTNDVVLLNDPVTLPLVLQAVPGLDDNLVGGLTSQFLEYKQVTWVNNNPTMSVAHIGDGVVVITSRGPSIKLNRTQSSASYTDNSGFVGQSPDLTESGMASAKLAVNIISLLTEYRQEASGSRKTSSTAISVGAPLLLRSGNANLVNSPPVVYKGLIVASVGNRIVAYDADPSSDIDGDGDPDDGIPDYNLGASEDVVWQSTTLTGPLSSPVCVDVPGADTTEVPTEQVLVVDGNGRLLTLNLAPKTNGVYIKTPGDQPVIKVTGAGGGSPIINGAPNSPTVHEGLAYVTDMVNSGTDRGRVWVVDLKTGDLMKTGTNGWVLGAGGSPIQLPPFTHSPTIGYIPIADNSGGADKVLYAPFKYSNAGVPSSGFTSIWLGAKGEKPAEFEPASPTDTPATALTVTTRASQQGGLPIYIAPGGPLSAKLTLLTATGAYNQAQMNNLFDGTVTDEGGGVLSFEFRSGPRSLPADVTGIRVDYTIDLNTDNAGVLTAIERGRINLPDISSGAKQIVNGPIALAPNGNLFLTSQNPDPSSAGVNRGAVYGFKEEGRGLFKMILRYEVYDDHTITLNGGGTQTYASMLADHDPFQNLVSAATGGLVTFTPTLKNYRVVGGPIVRNGQVLVTVGATQALSLGPQPGSPLVPVPSTLVLAFSDDPEVPQVYVGPLPEGSTLIQPDMARSTSTTRPEVMSTLANANFNYNEDTGIIRFENLSSVQKGVVQQSFSQSQPFIVRRPGNPDVLLEPNSTAGNRWSPLLWYSVLQGFNCTGPNQNGPVATGDTIYIPGGSSAPNILTGNGFAPTGMVYALRTNAAPGNGFLLASPGRPWQSQFDQFDPSFKANPAFQWPLNSGVTSFSQYVVRLRQSTLSANGVKSNMAYGVVGGDGALVAWGDQGLYTFSRSDFLIADEGRIGIFDPAGNQTWSTGASVSTGEVGNGSIGTIRPLARPTRAYQMPDKSILAVDTGASRIAVIHPSGTETRSIDSFMVDPVKTPAGFQANESLKLSGPRDVAVYTTYESWPELGQFVTRGDGNVAAEFWVHYLIADSGNCRLIELIDRYQFNPNTNQIQGAVMVTTNGVAVPQLGVLLWHSPAEVSTTKFTYNSVSRLWVPAPGGGGRYVYVAGIGSGLPTRADSGLDTPDSGPALRSNNGGNGGIVIFDPSDPKGIRVVNQILVPDIDADVFWNDATNSFNSPAKPGGPRLLSNVSSVTTRVIPGSSGAVVAIMITDATGVYEVAYDLTSDPTVDILPVRWMLPNEAYRAMRRIGNNTPAGNNVPLRATYARRLDNGEVLLVNGYYGPNRAGAQSHGEVLQIDGSASMSGNISVPNFGFDLLSITYELPPIAGARGLVIPVFADRR